MDKELKNVIESNKEINRIWKNVGLAGYRGSVAHGTAGDVLDDIDIGGVFISPIEHYFGLSYIEHLQNTCVNEKYDFCLYEIKKFFRLLLKSNPNVLCMLWLPEHMYIQLNDWGRQIRQHRHLFMSKQMHSSFAGYAHGQLKRMNNPCTNQAFQGKKRKERFEKFGYDCKNASHLIRLLKMGIETLTTGEVFVQRHDAEYLKEIKNGKYSLEHITNEANNLKTQLDEAVNGSPLPEKPQYKEAEELLMSILKKEITK